MLKQTATQYGLTLDGFDYQNRFEDLVVQLAQAHNDKVVFLVDEYDKPIVDNLDNLDEARAIRDTLRNLYGVAKAMTHHWRFVFVTGISKFSRVGVFSTMNNLDDLTMDYRFADALGITEEELCHYFQPYIAELAEKEQITSDELLAKIRHWYDGFRFAPEGQSLNYWFSTGTPHFLIKLLTSQDYALESLDGIEVSEMAFETYELDNLDIIPVLFQTGYLTIKDVEEDGDLLFFTLSYPNWEVKNAFMAYLLNAYNNSSPTLTESHLRYLIRSLRNSDLEQFFEILNWGCGPLPR